MTDVAKSFTPWLAKVANLKMLSAVFEVDFVLEEMESSVGAFSAEKKSLEMKIKPVLIFV